MVPASADLNCQFQDLGNLNKNGDDDVFVCMQKMQMQLLKAISDQNLMVQKMFTDMKVLQDNVIRELKSEIVSLKNDVIKLKSVTISGINDDNARLDDQNIYKEMLDRASRSNNIMIYNIEECTSSVQQTRIEYDVNKVTNVLKTLEVGNSEKPIVIRVGRKSDKPRPIKAILKDSKLVRLCLKNKDKLKDFDIKIGSDQTLDQRNQFKKMKKELNERINAGETDIKISFKFGVPSITKVPKN